MRKILSILFLVLAFVACENDDESDDKGKVPSSNSFVGSYDVTKQDMPPYFADNFVFKVDIDAENKTMTVTMDGVKFAAMMPAQNIVIPNVNFIMEDGDATVSLDSIIPLVDSVAMPGFKIKYLDIELDNNELDMEFDCNGFVVDYEGAALKTNYLGEYEVKEDGDSKYTEDEAEFILELEPKDSTLTLTMNDIKFSQFMPVRLNIVANDVKYLMEGGKITAKIENIIPTVQGAPMEKYKLYNLEIEVQDSELDVKFDCKDSNVEYSGDLIEK